MKIAVVALGKIGLPLAVQFASKGHEVVGVDVNATVVDLVNAGTEPFPGEAHLQEKLSSTVADGRLRATTDYGDAVPGPTPLCSSCRSSWTTRPAPTSAGWTVPPPSWRST